MTDCGGDLHIVFNGEIYNFRELRVELEVKGRVFRTRSDTEIILAAYREWGTDCLSHLSGMFAFALYDAQRRQLFLARDRAGEKPLFYMQQKGELRFSSEIKGLLADPRLPRGIDAHALDCYLAQGFVSGDRCILKGFNKLPPAHALTFTLDDGRCCVWRYWQLPAWNSNPRSEKVDECALLDQLEELTEKAVGRQLVADVPVGILLSGGVDSSLVTAMAVRAASDVKTFTVTFPGYARFDERKHARLIAQHFRTHHAELEAEATTPALLPILARQFDEPVIDSSMVPTYLVSRLIREHCKVALGGDGGDELFGGYSHYDKLLWMQTRFGWLPRPLRGTLAKVAKMALPVGYKGRNWLSALQANLDYELPLVASYYDLNSRRKLLLERSPSTGAAEQIWKKRAPDTLDLLQRATRMDFENYLAEDILVKVDRASMLNSLEVRAPLLDPHIVEFAFGVIPSNLKATASTRKVLLKNLAKRLLPDAFDQKRKQGFSIPLGSWLRTGPWLKYFRELLLDDIQPLFDRRVVEALIEGQIKGRANDERLFGLVMFELWRQEYQVVL